LKEQVQSLKDELKQQRERFTLLLRILSTSRKAVSIFASPNVLPERIFRIARVVETAGMER
jgi:hypothetical protein